VNVTVAVARKGPPKPTDTLTRIPGNASPHEMCDPFDIGEALFTLSQSGAPLTVYTRAHETILARIDSVDPELPHFVLDFSSSRLPPVGCATLVASITGNAKLQFDLTSDWAAVPGQPHLVPATFPDFCLVLNRRTGRRVETPVGGHFTASFTISSRKVEWPLYDLSEGGVGMRAMREDCVGLHVGKKLMSVRLELGPALAIVVDLEVRLLRPFRTFLLGEQVQVGCSFASISMQMQQTLARFVASGQTGRGSVALANVGGLVG
jgi:c-di-GMP-binding flagellar brake protein YcgR